MRRDPSCARAEGRDDRAARHADRRHSASTRLDVGDAQFPRVCANLGASAGGLGVMDFDLARLSEDDLVELNRRIVERLQLLRSAKSLAQVARFSVGMVVEFDTDDGRTISGTVARLNQRTATVVTASGRWRVNPTLLRAAAAP